MKLLSGMIAALLLLGTVNHARAALAEPPVQTLLSEPLSLARSKDDRAAIFGQNGTGPISAGSGQPLKGELHLNGVSSPAAPPLSSPAAAVGIAVRGGQVIAAPRGQDVRKEQKPVESADLIVSSVGPFTLASQPESGKPQRGFYLDNPDIPGAGVQFSSPAITNVTTAQSPAVPLPPPLLLFGSGLAGLIALKKKGRFSWNLTANDRKTVDIQGTI